MPERADSQWERERQKRFSGYGMWPPYDNAVHLSTEGAAGESMTESQAAALRKEKTAPKDGLSKIQPGKKGSTTQA